MNSEVWQPYLISVVIGLLIGIEREKAHPEGKTMGVRTFLLMGLLGALAGGIEGIWLPVLIAAFCFSLITVSYFNVTFRHALPQDRGLTTEFAASIVFCLGFISHAQPMVTALIGPVVAVVLVAKDPLHRFTGQLKPAEIQAALLLLLFGVSVLHLLEDRAVDPWGIFNPRKFGMLVLILAALEFCSYALSKVLGQKSGTLVAGFLGGLVSSTAVLLSSSRQAIKNETAWRSLLGTALAATVSSLGQMLFIVGIVSPPLLRQVALPVGSAMVTGLAALFLVVLKAAKSHSEIDLKSPLDWGGVFRLALLLGAILAAVALAKKFLGDEATLIVSALTAMFELHGVSLANATMFANGQLEMPTAVSSILLACTASLVAKIGISWTVNRGPFSRLLTLIFILMAGAIWLSTLVL